MARIVSDPDYLYIIELLLEKDLGLLNQIVSAEGQGGDQMGGQERAGRPAPAELSQRVVDRALEIMERGGTGESIVQAQSLFNKAFEAYEMEVEQQKTLWGRLSDLWERDQIVPEVVADRIMHDIESENGDVEVLLSSLAVVARYITDESTALAIIDY